MKPGPYVGEFDGRPASSQQPAQVLPPVPEDDDLNLRDPVNEYSPGSPLPEDVEIDDDVDDKDEGIGSGLPTLEECAADQPSASRLLEESSKRASSAGDEADSKRPKLEDAETLLFNCLDVCEAAGVLTVELDLTSNREKKKLLHHPSLFLAQKLRDCEVRYEKLRPEHRVLFDRAKTKEVNSFLANQAVRRCLNSNGEIEAKQSGRLMRCRWVLTWKPTPVESLEEAQDAIKYDTHTRCQEESKGTYCATGLCACTLISLLVSIKLPLRFKQSSQGMSPTSSWDVEGIDMSTAFLQTLPTEESQRLWTSGERELREALNGSTTAPKNLFQKVDSSLKGLGAVKIKGDACF